MCTVSILIPVLSKARAKSKVAAGSSNSQIGLRRGSGSDKVRSSYGEISYLEGQILQQANLARDRHREVSLQCLEDVHGDFGCPEQGSAHAATHGEGFGASHIEIYSSNVCCHLACPFES